MKLFQITLKALSLRLVILSLAFIGFLPVSASAQDITPHGAFGSQPEMGFNGSGIPNDWVLTNGNAATLGVTLGLTAHQRYDNPALTNDGAGTFFANPGIDTHAPSPGDPHAVWNWAWFIGGDNVANYGYRFYYDFNSAVGNDRSDHGFIEWAAGTVVSTQQDSWNSGMDFLAITNISSPLLTWTSPISGSFDPMAEGEYTFLLEMFNETGVLGSVGMAVQVGDVPTETVPEPATMTLLATGLAGMAAAKKRRKK